MRIIKILGCYIFAIGIGFAIYQLYAKRTEVTVIEDTNIHICIGSNCDQIGISGILSSQEDLLRYLSNLESIHNIPIVDINIDSFEFDQFDYIIIPGRSMVKLTRLMSDDCSKYDTSGLIPVTGTFKTDISTKVHVYKISSKNKYRWVCG